VNNLLPEPTSMHAHGLFERGTPWYDGVSGVTQCPIPPEQSLTYRIDTTTQAGTTWYHAHYQTQYVDGFVGPLIIRDPFDPYQSLYDEEIIVVLSDWYHEQSPTLVQTYLAPGGNGNEPIPDSGLINGKGRYDCALLTDPVQRAACQPNAPRETFTFVPGRRYRLRLINTSAFTAFQFSIDQHSLTVIEADMVNMEPQQVTRLNINVAQRYSVIVQANQAPGNYWMRATMSTDCYPTTAPNLDRYVVANVHYEGAPMMEPAAAVASTPEASDMACIDLAPYELRPLKKIDAEHPATTVTVTVSFHADSQNVNRGYMNNSTYVADFTNSMISQLSTGAVTEFSTVRNVIQLPANQWVRMVIINDDNGEHPFHLHGHEFQVLAWATGTYRPGRSKLHTRNPPRRDTSTMPASGYTVIQFFTDNIGVWNFHCHIDWHVAAGLVANIQVGTPTDFAQLEIPPDVAGLCNTAT